MMCQQGPKHYFPTFYVKLLGGESHKTQNRSSHLGIEPRTFGLEVQRAILCANGTLAILRNPEAGLILVRTKALATIVKHFTFWFALQPARHIMVQVKSVARAGARTLDR